MTSSPDESTILFSRMVAAASTALLMVFCLTILSSMLPIRVIDPAWQLGLATTIVNNGGFALIGLLLLHLAIYLDPANRRWEARAAPTAGALQSRLEVLQGPALMPADLLQPLPQLRQQLLIALEQAEASVRSRLPVVGPDQWWSLLEESIRVAGSALAFAFAFAAAAQRPNASQSLFSEIGCSWEGWIRARSISFSERRKQREQSRHALRLQNYHQRSMKESISGRESKKKAQENDPSLDQ